MQTVIMMFSFAIELGAISNGSTLWLRAKLPLLAKRNARLAMTFHVDMKRGGIRGATIQE